MVKPGGVIFASVWEEHGKVWDFFAMDFEFFRKFNQNPSYFINLSSSWDSDWFVVSFPSLLSTISSVSFWTEQLDFKLETS